MHDRRFNLDAVAETIEVLKLSAGCCKRGAGPRVCGCGKVGREHGNWVEVEVFANVGVLARYQRMHGRMKKGGGCSAYH